MSGPPRPFRANRDSKTTGGPTEPPSLASTGGAISLRHESVLPKSPERNRELAASIWMRFSVAHRPHRRRDVFHRVRAGILA